MKNKKFRKFVVYMMMAVMLLSTLLTGISFLF
ncbi:stressosome-associated protein Prli42 [Peribacillus alkalitolerans]|nr:stressosome-associated protein Prli42 [Peribacillus alkalitolerans]